MKTAVILGATSGVGAFISRRLLEADWIVYGFHRGRMMDVKKVAETMERYPRLILTKCDVGSQYDEAFRAFSEMAKRLDAESIDLLVHSISGASIGDGWSMPHEATTLTFNRLAHSFAWWVGWLKFNNLFEVGAQALALSSPCPDFYLRKSGVIGPAKAALEAYVKMLACELNGHPRVNGLRFSTVMTAALEKVVGTKGVEKMERLHESIVPRGRMQTPGDVASLVHMLTSDDALWLNGAIIDGTGGPVLKLMDYAFHGPRVDR